MARHGCEAVTHFGSFPVKKLVARFRRNEQGAALAEYALLVATIAVVCVVAVTAVGTKVSTAFSQIASAI